MRDSRRVPGVLCGLNGYRSEYIDGEFWKHCWQIPDNPLRFIAAVGDRILTPPDRFVHDFASVWRIIWPIIGPPAGCGPGAAYGPAAIPHDWAYEHQAWDNGEPISRAEADAILWECCFDLNVTEWRRRLMYRAVRIGGGPHFRGHKSGRIPCPDYSVG